MGIAIAVTLYAVMIVAMIGLVVLVPLFAGAMVYDLVAAKLAERKLAPIEPLRSRAVAPRARLSA
ncbi:MAG TPA: hypothetical protein VF902_00235 [Coriobacteriia bacterium]